MTPQNPNVGGYDPTQQTSYSGVERGAPAGPATPQSPSLPHTKDSLEGAPVAGQPQPIPKPDSPQLPIPTMKAKKLMATDQALKVGIIAKGEQTKALTKAAVAKGEQAAAATKAAGTTGVAGAGKVSGPAEAGGVARAGGIAGATGAPGASGVTNPWLSNPSFLGAFLEVMLKLLSVRSETRFNEAESRSTIRDMVYKMGQDNANINAILKNKEAGEQFTQAISSFVTGTLQGVQALSSISSSKAEAQRISDEGEIGKDIRKTENDLSDLKNKLEGAVPGKPVVDASSGNMKAAKAQFAANVAAYDTRLDAFKQSDPGKELMRDIKSAEGRLQRLGEAQYTEVNRIASSIDSRTQSKYDALKSFVQSASSMTIALSKAEQAEIEKQKGMTDALLQMLNKLDDSMTKEKDEAAQEVGKIIQAIIQMSQDNQRAHQLGRG